MKCKYIDNSSKEKNYRGARSREWNVKGDDQAVLILLYESRARCEFPCEDGWNDILPNRKSLDILSDEPHHFISCYCWSTFDPSSILSDVVCDSQISVKMMMMPSLPSFHRPRISFELLLISNFIFIFLSTSHSSICQTTNTWLRSVAAK